METVAKEAKADENPWMPNGVPLVQLPPKPEGLSKNQWKKQLKEKKYFADRETFKEARKIKRSEVRKRKKEIPIEQRKQKIRRQESGFKLLIDLSFDEYMAEKEIKSTAGQLIYSYAAGRTYGLSLSLTSISTKLDKYLSEKSCDYKKWNALLSEKHFSTLQKNDFNIEVEPKFCYLTADSENEIQELDKNTIYVIGGIVDKNRHKNLCLAEANRLKILHARLPVSKYIEMQTRKVLTINHVVGILGEFTISEDWEKSFLTILPRRKGAVPSKTADKKVEDKIQIPEKESPTRKPTNQVPQNEYIKNLQQQIYLLELETRYMHISRAGKKNAGDEARFLSRNALNSSILQSMQSFKSASTAGLNQNDDTEENDISNLNSVIKSLKDNEVLLQNQIEELTKRNLEIKDSFELYKEKTIGEKDRINGELLSAKQKIEEVLSTSAHLEITMKRIQDQKELIELQKSQLANEVSELKQKISEQLELNQYSRQVMEKTQVNALMQAEKIKQLEETIMENNVDLSKKQIATLQSKLSSAQSDIEAVKIEKDSAICQQDLLKEGMKKMAQRTKLLELELEEARSLKEQNEVRQSRREPSMVSTEVMIGLENEVKMQKISLKAKDEFIMKLNEKIKNIELDLLKTAEQLAEKKDSIQTFEQLIRNRAHELIQIGQDKCFIQDELAEYKNQYDKNAKKIGVLEKQNIELTAKVTENAKEINKWKEFLIAIDQVEETGQNYFAIMKDLKSQIQAAGV